MKYQFRLFLILCASLNVSLFAQQTIDVSDSGWRLWLDKEAAWEKDSIFLPADVNLTTLPANAPTGGWKQLHSSAGIEVSLPSTVEEHYWGVNGFRKYQDEYFYETQDTVPKNGNYLGVSWWWKEISIPKSFAGKHVKLFIRGARLRAEVYLNQKLIGYNIITEGSFDCDASSAGKPGGKNILAIRITNPGGRLDWLDTQLMPWGKTDQTFHRSHGFGGLDRGITISAHDKINISDLWVLNTPKAGNIQVHAAIANKTGKPTEALLRVELLDPDKSNKVCSTKETKILLNGSAANAAIDLTYANASLWNLDTPKLYTVRATVIPASSSKREGWKDMREVTAGFRWFEADGIGSNAMLKFNGDRIRITSAISWGFWGINGLWPTKEFAEREVRAAKSFGMNCIQFHRNVGKTEALDAHDRLGLFRYMEPGGGQTSFGEKFSLYSPSPKPDIDDSGMKGDAQTFAERYMEEKIVRMVRDHRSHPSLLLYAIQNEIHPDLNNPRVFRILRRIHEEDPSRIVVVKSGFPSGSPSMNQAWMQPYSDVVLHDTGDAYSGWWDDHTVGGPGVWRDEMYQNPEEFTHRSVNNKEIVMWGEMLGSAVTDNHEKMITEINRHGGKSYDLQDHRDILDSYNNFLDHWGFRKAFPTADALFTSIGNKSYDFWGRVLETARLAEANDYFVISGWESTAIENHSGLVDNLRQFKGDPALIKNRLAPLRIVIKTPAIVYEAGDSIYADLFLLNETHKPHKDSIYVQFQDPSGTISFVKTFSTPKYGADQFVYPIARHIYLGQVRIGGEYSIKAQLGKSSGIVTEEKILGIMNVDPSGLPKRIGIITDIPKINNIKEVFPGIVSEPYAAGKQYDLLLAANKFIRPAETITDANTEIQNTDDDEIYRTINFGEASSIEFIFPNLPKDTALVTLKFAELFQNAVDMRIFDVALNGNVVLKDFDVYKAAGGKNIAFETTFKIVLTDGALQITFPRTPKPSARICGFKVAMKDTVVAVNCGGSEYRDKKGLLWKSYGSLTQLPNSVLELVKKGTPLIILAEGQAAVESYGKQLGEAGVLEYKGCVSEAFASWMGSWYFVRSHPLYDGLPVNCAMQSYYQAPVTNGTGMLVEGKNVEIIAAYSRDHSRQIGAGSFTATYGSGKVVVHTLPGCVSNLYGEKTGIHPAIFKRILANSLYSLTH